MHPIDVCRDREINLDRISLYFLLDLFFKVLTDVHRQSICFISPGDLTLNFSYQRNWHKMRTEYNLCQKEFLLK
jgi:hypothetical protein